MNKEDNTTNRTAYHRITSAEAKQMMDEMSPNEYILLDVRSQEEFDAGYINGAMLIPDNELQKRMNKELSDKAKPIFVYCRSGYRSERSAKLLAQVGYQKIYDFGGIIDWKYDIETNY